MVALGCFAPAPASTAAAVRESDYFVVDLHALDYFEAALSALSRSGAALHVWDCFEAASSAKDCSDAVLHA